MPKKKLQKSLQDYLSKIKNKPTPNIHNSKKFILSGCKHPKTRSFAVDRTRVDDTGNDEAALADIDRFLFENFKSLYLHDEDRGNEDVQEKKDKESNSISGKDSYTGRVLFESPRFLQPPRDICGSSRFFGRAGSSSGSLVEDAWSSTTSSSKAATSTATAATTFAAPTTAGMSFTDSMADNGSTSTANDGQKEVKLPEDCIAVLAQSSSPYEDFVRSMQEMVNARMRNHGRADWEFMEEILFCYLDLNEKKSHKYILNAFVDLIMALRRRNGSAPAATVRQHAEPGRGVRESRRRRPRRDIAT